MKDNSEQPNSQPIGRAMIYLMWIALIVVIALMMQNWLNKQHNPNQYVRVIESTEGNADVVLQRNKYGHYVSNGSINGVSATFFLDTGATDVSIPAEIADRYGLTRGYPMQVSTANGLATVYRTNLETVELGPLRLSNVQASINPNMDGDEILLGMSFLKHLDFTQRGDELILSTPGSSKD